jgi:methionyl-tRNA formyltransferase
MSSSPAIPRPRRVIFMGSPAIAVPSLEALVASGESVVAVVTQPDRPAGRGRPTTSPPAKLAAERLGLPCLQPPTLRNRGAVEELRALRPDIIVIVAFGQILRSDVLALPPLGCVNLHPSLLPKLRGPTPINWAILEGLDETGVTVMVVDGRVDSGPILAQERTDVRPDDTAASLGERLATQGAVLLAQTVQEWAEGRVTPVPQDDGKATYSRLLKHEDGLIDWLRGAAEIERRSRAFYPWPGAFTHWNGRILKILRMRVRDEEDSAASSVRSSPGAVLGLVGGIGDGLAIGTGDGSIVATELQLEGRRSLPARELVRGQPGIIGSQLGLPAG